MTRATCRSCGLAILWVTTTNGKLMPLDPEPVPNGNITLCSITGVPVATTHRVGQRLEEPAYISHFATCPDRGSWRK